MEKKHAEISWINVAVVVGLFLAALALLAVGIHAVVGKMAFGTDIYMFWLAGRGTFVQGISPYDPQIVAQSQMGIYGRLANPGEDILAFSYPPYSLIPIAPVSGISFEWAQAWWLAFLSLALLSVGLLAFPETPRALTTSLLLAYPFTFGLILGNYAILLGVLLIVFYRVLAREEKPPLVVQSLVGMLLAWYTIKPQFVWLFLLLLLLLALRRRWWGLLAGFGGGLLLLLAISFWMAPTWVPEWLGRLAMYARENNGSASTLQRILSMLLPRPLVSICFWFLAAACAVCTVWVLFRCWQGEFSLLQGLGWSGLVIYAFHPHSFITYEQIIFWIPLVIWLWQQARRRPWLVWVLWASMVGLSWVGFILGKFFYSPWMAVVGETVFLGYIVWIMWFLRYKGENKKTG